MRVGAFVRGRMFQHVCLFCNINLQRWRASRSIKGRVDLSRNRFNRFNVYNKSTRFNPSSRLHKAPEAGTTLLNTVLTRELFETLVRLQNMTSPRHTYKLSIHTYQLGIHTYQLSKHTYYILSAHVLARMASASERGQAVQSRLYQQHGEFIASGQVCRHIKATSSVLTRCQRRQYF